MDKAKSVGCPLAGHFKLSSNQSPTSDKDKDEDKDEMLKISYVLAVGYLMYVVVCTRPDIAHSVETSKVCLSFENGKSMLDGFTDSDMAGYEAEHGPLELSNQLFFRSPRDADGHGTHTASTVAGAIVVNTTYPRITVGTARGGSTSARLAIYKACWFNLCSDADILAAFDDTINDDVDIISFSIGPSPPQPSYFQDANSIGSFHAFHRGILISGSAGNSAFSSTATNVAPWIITVAASSIDREF
ncbi:hypothetical protein HYC85_032007 [Camellia sinensis]|uniref:Peptidase S8/S53 domain-containing protein n=1 Tax=Camellia sinensis TaxID=4442 RepID=A0A7J7FW28_CAMSI|nr:hypothetical protein HYC85_032007 [Camellia sinensis]